MWCSGEGGSRGHKGSNSREILPKVLTATEWRYWACVCVSGAAEPILSGCPPFPAAPHDPGYALPTSTRPSNPTVETVEVTFRCVRTLACSAIHIPQT
jgi:hypothetical protein